MLSLSAEDVQEWLDTCKLSARSRATYLSVTHSFFYFARTHGFCAVDPTEFISRPRTRRLVPRPISDADLEVALACAPPRMRAWLALGAYQGLRCVEIAGLRREDVMENREPAMLLVSAAKGGRERLLPLNGEVASALHCYGMPAFGYVFRLSSGRPLKAATVSAYIGRYLRGLGIAASAHQARHWFGSTLYQQTLDLRFTQEMLGHADPKSSAIYAAFAVNGNGAIVQDLRVRPVGPRHTPGP